MLYHVCRRLLLVYSKLSLKRKEGDSSRKLTLIRKRYQNLDIDVRMFIRKIWQKKTKKRYY